MKDDEIYNGFDSKKQAEYEAYLVEQYGESARSSINKSKQKSKHWKKEDYEKVQKDYDELHREFVGAIEGGRDVRDPIVQSLVTGHYAVVSQFWSPDCDAYTQLGQMYCKHTDFRKLYDSYHPKLAEYLAEAMSVYAKKELR